MKKYLLSTITLASLLMSATTVATTSYPFANTASCVSTMNRLATDAPYSYSGYFLSLAYANYQTNNDSHIIPQYSCNFGHCEMIIDAPAGLCYMLGPNGVDFSGFPVNPNEFYAYFKSIVLPPMEAALTAEENGHSFSSLSNKKAGIKITCRYTSGKTVIKPRRDCTYTFVQGEY